MITTRIKIINVYNINNNANGNNNTKESLMLPFYFLSLCIF